MSHMKSFERLFNMTSGPVALTQRVALAQLKPQISPYHQDFWPLFEEVQSLLKKRLRTEAEIVLAPNSIRGMTDWVIGNLVEPGDKVLCVYNGFWGRLFADIVSGYGGVPIPLECRLERSIPPERVAEALEKNPDVKAVTLAHVETSTGVLNPLSQIGKTVRKHGALLVVDTACSAGAIGLETDSWEMDVGITGSHKCLCAAPGLGILSVGDRAWRSMESRRQPFRGWFSNLIQWRNIMLERKSSPAFTTPMTLLFALREALLEAEEYGIEAFLERHERAGTAFRAGLSEMGLRIIPDEEEESSDTVQAVWHPGAIEDAKFRELMGKRYGILILGNLRELMGRSFRVGLMSPPQIEDTQILATLTAIEGSMIELGAKIDPGSAVRGAMPVLKG